MEKKKHRLYLSSSADTLSIESFIVLHVILHCQLDNVEIVLVEDDEKSKQGVQISNCSIANTELGQRDLTNGGGLHPEKRDYQYENERNDSVDMESVFMTKLSLSENNVESDMVKLVHFIPVSSDMLRIFSRITKTSQDFQGVNLVSLPALTTSDRSLIVIGICGIIRFLIKNLEEGHPTQKLLGFRGGCLSAPSEVSIWTNFCEKETVEVLKIIRLDTFPTIFAKLEKHLRHPVRTHNVVKKVLDKKGKRICDQEQISLKELQENAGALLDHKFAEGQELTLSDLVLFPSFYILVRHYKWELFAEAFPSLSRWYSCIEKQWIPRIDLAVDVEEVKEVRIPEVDDVSLYTRDPTRGEKKGTDQSQLDEVFKKFVANIRLNHLPEPDEYNFDWLLLPPEAHPTGGDLPLSRAKRKCDQLQSIILAVKKIAQPGDVIVDFCSGGGHLGIILAFILTECTVIMIDNKSESVNRALQRVSKLGLKNMKVIQGNINYFTGDFSIGVALHACGSATDIVLNACISRSAKFVVCPCCYGGVQPSSDVIYPRSRLVRERLSVSEYLVLAHSADQTHGVDNKKTEQGFQCMDLVDSDRALHAEEFGYKVCLTKLKPESCSLKNNLLIGVKQ